MTKTTGQPRYKGPALPHITALYCRVSSKRQGEDDKTSLKTQLAALKKYAADLGWAVDDRYIYEDRYSGEELHQRPALARLRQDAKTRAFGLVLAYNVYALAKNQAHMAILLDEWEHIGIGLDFATEKLENDSQGRLMLAARTFAAEVEGERRKDRMIRSMVARAQLGKPPNGVRPTFGYQWPDVRDKQGRLTKTNQERNPTTWPIVERIWARALTGGTLHGIAVELTNDGIPTPSGLKQWDPSTIRYILTNGIYWGKPMTLRRQQVAVEVSVRAQYAHKSRACWRPVEEWVALPADYAPAVVSPDDAAQVHKLLRLNKELATPNVPAVTGENLLVRGMAICGYCHRRLGVSHPTSRRPGIRRTIYKCRKGQRFTTGCEHHSITAHKLDDAVWVAIKEILTHPELLEAEVAYMREQGDPAGDTLAAIDRQVADVRRRIKNKRAYAEEVDDARERVEVAAEVKVLREQEEALEAERTATLSHYADWRDQQEGLAHTIDWCAAVAGNLDTLTFQQRRETLFTLRTEVLLWRADHTPRAELTVHLPSSGAWTAELDGLNAAPGDEQYKSCSAASKSAHRAPIESDTTTALGVPVASSTARASATNS
jgi:site-specific DNA recombinase